MSKYVINDTTLTAIADAVREKSGTTDLIKVSELPTAIAAIESGGGGVDIPEEAFTITGDCSGMFSNDKWKWFYDAYNDKITFTDILTAADLFANSSYTDLDFEINLASTGSQNGITQIFSNMPYLKQLDSKINGKFKSPNIAVLFQYDYQLKSIGNIFENCDMSYMDTYDYGQQHQWFHSCYSLREIDEHFWDNVIISRTSNYGHLYHNLYYYCFTLDKATLPINTVKESTSNCFASTSFQYLSRAQDILFITNVDDSPQTAKWSNQTIDLGNKYVGYCYESNTYRGYILNYNSGITADKEVKDDTTYQALKDDPDWFTTNHRYSRYNHDSAVNTINSLPDTSAYLATAGGTNTIKFEGAQGSATDGGAINTLTEEEIAVATAKGWTVSLT